MIDSPRATWREVVDRSHSTLIDELQSTLDSAFGEERARAAETARVAAEAERSRCAAETERVRISIPESLNQIMRRLRQAESDAGLFEVLADSTSSYADRVVVLSVESGQTELRGVARRAVDEADLTIEVNAAPALGAALESKDPVTALASSAEISPALAAALVNQAPGHKDDKLYLFPLVIRHDVVAMLVASGNVSPAALELLCGACGLKLESLNPEVAVLRPLPTSELVQIEAPEVPGTAASRERRIWSDLSPDDQKLHLQAQRMARVKVAEMRLYHADELRNGTAAGNIYGALRAEIDDARKTFLQSYLSKSPTMVDYLHLELLRSLAHDDDNLLGEDYPGPMV